MSIDQREIDEFDRLKNIMNGVESSVTVPNTSTPSSGTPKTFTGELSQSHIQAMDSAIKALYEAEKAAKGLSVQEPTTDKNKDESDDIDNELEYDDEIRVESLSEGYRLSVGGVVLVPKSLSMAGLIKLKEQLSEGKSLASPQCLKTLKHIGVLNASSRKLKESKAKYQKYKEQSNAKMMAEEKRAYNIIKEQINESKRFLDS